jgi:DNA-binding HxlR family transcriptional regulator
MERMQRHAQYCPVFFAADILGDRWNLLIMREMMGGASRFNEIERCLPSVSRSLLIQRLRLLTRHGLIDTLPLESGRGSRYSLTPAGKDLEPVLMAMGEWAVRWVVGEPRPEELDPTFLVYWLHRRIKFDEVPAKRTVIRLDVIGDARDVFWLVVQPDEASLCTKDPGLGDDIYVVADSMALQRVFAGRITLDVALADESITITGPAKLVRNFGRWFLWSPFHDFTRAQLESEQIGAERLPR